MTLSSRTRARADARRQKRLDEDLKFGTSAASSKTLIETCMSEIVRVTRKALDKKDEMSLEHTDPVALQALEEKYAELKGQVNGLVWMYCKCWVNPYEPHLSNAVKSVRREAVKRARAQMASKSNG
jgi:hypothetical protein